MKVSSILLAILAVSVVSAFPLMGEAFAVTPAVEENSAKVTGPNTLEIKFISATPRISVDNDGAVFTPATNGDDVTPRDIQGVRVNGTTVTLTLGGEPLGTGATGIISSPSDRDGLVVTDQTARDDEYTIEDTFTDAQKPVVKSAKITGPKQVTIEFSENVIIDGEAGNFTGFVLNNGRPVGIVSASNTDADTVILATRGANIPTDATGNINIINDGSGTSATIRDTTGNVMAPVTGYQVSADQIPTVKSAKITGPNEVMIEFSKDITVLTNVAGDYNFSDFNVIVGDKAPEPREIQTVAVAGDTVTLTIRGSSIPAVATGTIDMTPTDNGATPPVYTGLFATVDTLQIPAAAENDYIVTDGQAPTIMTGYPKNTGLKEITIKFSEPVKANRTHFTDIDIPAGRDARTITSVTGSGKDTIVLKIGGENVDPNSPTVGDMSISDKITDLADTKLVVTGNTPTDGFFTAISILAGQAPTVESAKITEGNTIVIEFSVQVENLDAANFTFYYGNSARQVDATAPSGGIVSTTNADGNSVATLTILGNTLPATARGQIMITANVQNTATSVPIEAKRYDVTAGQIPMVESAKITDSNEITIVFSEAIDDTTTSTITSDTFDNHFKNFKLTGGTDVTIGDTRDLKWISDADSANDDKTAFTFTIDGSQLPTDATGTIDLIGIKDNSSPQIPLNNRDRTLSQPVTDGQNPTIESIRITAPNTITVKSSEPINASLDNFTDFTLASGGGKNISGISVDMNRYSDAIELTIGGDALASDASGTIVINPTKDDDDKSLTLIDRAGNPVEFVMDGANDGDPNVMDGTAEVMPGQVPILMTGYPKITGPNEVTIMFSTEVDASRTMFTEFIVDGEDDPRRITDIDGSGSDTITLTIDGNPIDAEKEGTINITDGIVGSNSRASFVAVDDADVTAGQAPTVASAKITSPSQIEIEFSDSVRLESSSSFTSLKINSDSKTYTVNSASASGNTVILDITYDDATGTSVDAELKHDATGTIQIGKEAVSNSISGVPNDIKPAQTIEDGQNPEVKSAKVTDNNTVTIEFTEAVNVESTDFDDFTINGETVERNLELMDGNGTDTIILEVAGTTLESDASALMSIKTTIMDLADNTLDDSTPTQYPVEAGQIPTVMEAVVSSPNTITITFSEPVDAELSDFTKIILGNTSRVAESIDGSDTDTIVLTIATTPANELDGDIGGSLTISDTITDPAGNTLEVGDSTTIEPDPDPTVESAKITGFNTVTIKFSEPITAISGDFVNFEIVIEGVSESRSTIIHESQLVDGTADTDTIILLVRGDPIPIGTAGTIDIVPSDVIPADDDATPPVIRTYNSLIDKNGQKIAFVPPAADATDPVYGLVDYPVEDDQSEPSDVSGTVTDSDGNTLSGAFVTISTDPEMNTVTNSAGVYMFSEIPAGIYEITAITPRDGELTRSITVPGGEYDFALAPDSLISGTITDTNGAGISEVTVRIAGVSSTTTDDDGMYSFDDESLIGKTVTVFITTPDEYEAVGNFFARVTVAAGENQTANFTLRSTATPTSGTVSGIVTDSDGNTISGATITVSGTSLTASTDNNGRYTIANVPIGSNSISVSVTGYNTAVQAVTVNAGQNTVNISLTPVPVTSNGGTIVGIITDSATRVGIQGITGTISTDPARGFTTGVGGIFNISGIPAGTYTISAVGANYNQGTTNVSVISGQPSTVTFSLTPVTVTSTGSISGMVTDSATNSPISGATVSIVGTSLSASTDSTGGYAILQVPVGTHNLAITSSGYTGGSGSVTVTADTTSTMNFSLTPVSMPGETNRVIGVVLDSSTGNMVSGATLTLSNNLTVTTQSSGAFQFSNVPVGSYALTVNAQGYNEYTDSDVEVTVGLPTSLRISLEPVAQPAMVQVTVTDSNGSPISGATVTLDGNTVTTDTNGMSTFNNVVAGTYTASATATGYESGTASVTATAGQPSDTTIALVPTIQPATISGMVWNDVNSNGMIDSFESVIPGATVTLYKQDGTTEETTTDSDGMYEFTGLGTELYTVYVSYEGDVGYAYEVPESGETITSDIGL